jgi:hypothetical protein
MNLDILTRKRVLFDLVCVGGVIGLSAGFFSLMHPKPAPPPVIPLNQTRGGPVFRNEWATYPRPRHPHHRHGSHHSDFLDRITTRLRQHPNTQQTRVVETSVTEERLEPPAVVQPTSMPPGVVSPPSLSGSGHR